MKVKLLFLSLLIGGLYGCDSAEISLVKSSLLEGYADITVGQALDNRKACSSVTWNTYIDNRDRKIVEYNCIFDLPGNFFERIVELDKVSLFKNLEYYEKINYRPDMVCIYRKKEEHYKKMLSEYRESKDVSRWVIINNKPVLIYTGMTIEFKDKQKENNFSSYVYFSEIAKNYEADKYGGVLENLWRQEVEHRKNLSMKDCS